MIRLTAVVTAILVSPALAQRVLHVGPGQEYELPSAAAAAAQHGDRVVIHDGDYFGDVCVWDKDDLVIRAAPGDRVHLFAAGEAAEGKAIWVIRGDNASVRGIEFVGCEVEDNNGAGIRLEGRGLLLRECAFRNNQTGLLTGANEESDVRIIDCEFEGSGAGDGLSHNIYVGRARSLEMRGVWSHGARVGHQLKSRAGFNSIVACRFEDGPKGNSSYLIDLPDGGHALVTGCILMQGANAENGCAISYGQESLHWDNSSLTVASNTIVSDRSSDALVRVAEGVPTNIHNNIGIGARAFVVGAEAGDGNVLDASAELVGIDPETLIPLEPSRVLDASVPLQAPSGVIAYFEYVHPASNRRRPRNTPLDIGALERE